MGVIWLLIEVNLISANIFGFPALFKVLPKYGVYNNYCRSTNLMNETVQDCNGQIQQYQVNSPNFEYLPFDFNAQNALTIGIIFFNIPSMFVGILIDMFGGRFIKLIGM